MAPNPFDPLEQLQAGRDALRRLQKLASSITLPSEHRSALVDGINKLMTPGEQLQAMVDLAETFGPPQRQLAEIQEAIVAQREQLEVMTAELDKVEQAVVRLSGLSEQLVALQEPFLRLLRNVDSEPKETE